MEALSLKQATTNLYRAGPQHYAVPFLLTAAILACVIYATSIGINSLQIKKTAALEEERKALECYNVDKVHYKTKNLEMTVKKTGVTLSRVRECLDL